MKSLWLLTNNVGNKNPNLCVSPTIFLQKRASYDMNIHPGLFPGVLQRCTWVRLNDMNIHPGFSPFLWLYDGQTL